MSSTKMNSNYYCNFRIKTQPVAKARARTVSKGGRTWSFTPKKTKDYEDLISKVVKKEHKGKPLSGPISLTCFFNFKRPKKCKALMHTKRPDGDNCLKAIKDALNGIIWNDDSQVFHATYYKKYTDKESPYIDVIVIEYNE